MPPEGVLKRNEVFTATERIISPKVSLVIGMHAQRAKQRNKIILLEEVQSRTILRESAICFKLVYIKKDEMKVPPYDSAFYFFSDIIPHIS